MYQIDFKQPVKVHFIGIGGISMSGLAELLLDKGFLVTGSDWNETELTRLLEEKQATVYRGQRGENISPDTDVVVYTAAIRPDNPEYQKAQELGIPMLTRAELLGQIMRNYGNAVAVAGTHGKTTTTSMLTEMMIAAGEDPTVSVGGMLDCIGGNFRVGASEYFLTEACEYTNSFLALNPTLGVILNVEEDHLDFFKDLEDVRRSFHLFASRISPGGLLVINGEIQEVARLTQDLPCRIKTFGRGREFDYGAKILEHDCQAGAFFELYKDGKDAGRFHVSLPGDHNVLNALAAIAAADELGIPLELAGRTLKDCQNSHRRFERKGEIGGVTIIDDYAHHPAEIRATLSAARNYPGRRVWCVFQPHTYSRTKAFLDEFADALALADEVVLADIYAARERDTLGVSSRDIAVRLEKKGVPVHYFKTFDEIEAFVLENCIKGDLLITMGAGDIVKVGENLLGL